MKRKFLSLTFFTLVIFIACAEKPDAESMSKESTVKSDTTEFYSFIKKIHENDSNIIVELDTISITESIDCIEDGSPIIKNEEILIEKFPLLSNAEITMQTLSHRDSGQFKLGEQLSVEEFIKLFNTPEFERFHFTPFEFKAVNNKIISIKEKYLP